MDWEYPALRGGQPYDKENFATLVKELKDEFWKYNLILTSAIGASKNTIDLAYDVKKLSLYLDFMHIMCYDYGGSWDKRVSANAPLTSNDVLSVQYTVQYLIELGASPSKIVMGLPFYGRTFLTSLKGNFGDESNDIGFQGPYTRENGFLGYNEICDMLTDRLSGWESYYDIPTAQAVARKRDDGEGQTKVVIYDSTRSVASKIRFMVRQKLAGAMVWSVDTDDFRGECDLSDDTYADYKPEAGVRLSVPKRINSNYPLLRTINEAIVVAEDELRQENEHKDESENEIPHGPDEEDSPGNGFRLLENIFVIMFAVSFVHLKNLIYF